MGIGLKSAMVSASARHPAFESHLAPTAEEIVKRFQRICNESKSLAKPRQCGKV